MANKILGLAAVALLSAPFVANALTCTSTFSSSSRSWSLTITETETSTSCSIGQGNPGAGDVATAFGGTWVNRGELTGNGTNSLLTAIVTSGSWGAAPVSGTWDISPSFWTQYADAVISFHVGGGQPAQVGDFALFLVKDLQTSGIWSFSQINMNGGGLSNIKLWSRGTATTTSTSSTTTSGTPSTSGSVPEPTSTLTLLGLGLIGLGYARRARRVAA
jgi:hypothetical protein